MNKEKIMPFNLTVDQIDAMSVAQIQAIPTSVIAQAPGRDFHELKSYQIQALTKEQIEAIPDSSFPQFIYNARYAGSSVISNFTEEQLYYFKPSQQRAMLNTINEYLSEDRRIKFINVMTSGEIGNINSQFTNNIPVTSIEKLTADQINGFRIEHLVGFTYDQIRAISPTAMTGIDLDEIKYLAESSTYAYSGNRTLNDFSPEQIAGLSPTVKAYISSPTFLSTYQIKTPSNISDGILKLLHPSLITAEFKSKLSQRQLGLLTSQQLGQDVVETITQAEFRNITPERLASLSPATIAAIPDNCWQFLTTAGVAVLTQAQLSAIPVDSFYQFRTDVIRAIPTNVMGVFTPAILRQFATQSRSSTNIIQFFTAEQIAALPADSKSYLSSQEYANTAKFTSLDEIGIPIIPLLHPSAFNTVTDAKLSHSGIPRYTGNRLGLLTTTQFQSLSPSAIRSLTTEDVGLLTTAEIAALTHTQLAVIRTTSLSALSTSQIAALSRAQVAALNTAQLSALSLAPVTLTTNDVATLNPGLIPILSTSVIASLSTKQIADLTPQQTAALTTSQIATLNSTQVAAIELVDLEAIDPTSIPALNTTAISGLTTSQVVALTTSQTSLLKPNQVKNLSTSQIAAMETEDITHLSPQSLAALTTNQTTALSTSQINALNQAGTVHVGTNTNPTTGATTTTLTPKKPPVDSNDGILDREWVKVSFMMSDSRLSNYDDVSKISQSLKDDIANRYWSSANRKFTDTRIGGNVAVNSRPQFNRYADIRVKGRLPNRKSVTVSDMSGNFGMGRYYSESYDDNAQTIYLRFGVPQYNSLFSFFTNAFNPGTAAFINTGRTKGLVYDIANIVGTVFTAVTFPVVTAFVVGSRIFSNIFSKPTSKFYTMKPTMFMYWSAVDMMVNAMNVNRGLMPKFPGGDKSSQRIGDPFNYDSNFIQMLSTKFPRVFNESGRIDIFSVALRAQKIANDAFMSEYEDLKNNRLTFEGYVRQADGSNEGASNRYVKTNGEPTLVAFLSYVGKLQTWFGLRDGSKNISEPSFKINPGGEKLKNDMQIDQSSTSNTPPSWANEFIQYLDSELSQGGAFATFRVDNTGSISESFSNSVMESDLSQKLNSTASQARQMSFSFAGGNLGDGMLASAIEGVANGVKDVALGALNGLTLGLSGSVEALIQGSYYDIPKTWQSSTSNLPKASYSMQLVSPYGHPLSQLQNIYIPLAMLLAAVLPRSTGKQTYGPPFLCQVWDRGRCQITLGMCTSLSITRGTANLPFNNRGQTMAIDISLEIEDLSSIMHMPIGTGSIWEMVKAAGSAAGLTSGGGLPMNDEDNILMNYLATITGLDLYNQLYPLPKARLALARTYAAAGKFSSPAYWASAVHDSATSGVLSYTPIGWGLNALEIGQRGSDMVTSGTGA